MIAFTWRGNAFFEWRFGEDRVLVDPWVLGNPGVELDLGFFVEEKPRYVFVTHGHPGHWGMGDSTNIARKSGAVFVAPAPLVTYLSNEGYLDGVRAIGMSAGEELDLGFARVELHEIPHPTRPPIPAPWSAVPADPNGLFLFQSEGTTIVHLGDAMPDPILDRIRDRGRADFLALPLWMPGDDENLGLVRSKQIIEQLEPRRVFCHGRRGDNEAACRRFKEDVMLRPPAFSCRFDDQAANVESLLSPVATVGEVKNGMRYAPEHGAQSRQSRIS